PEPHAVQNPGRRPDPGTGRPQSRTPSRTRGKCLTREPAGLIAALSSARVKPKGTRIGSLVLLRDVT
ncbi:hypothetical protein ABZZ16_36690, partial [Streptomyces sp. NPDC006386]|uniref:hypothetical protein n=1 Tax=Streptomyces sp. NPDC006386 TaxID=3156762 RepID=UPI0033AD7B31